MAGLADVQNGFRKERSCQDHVYSLYSIINNRNLKREKRHVCMFRGHGKSNRKAMIRNWCNQKANPALKTKTGNK